MHVNIWGSNSKRSNSLEHELQQSFERYGYTADIVNMERPVQRDGPLFIRNKFYGYLKKCSFTEVRSHIQALERRMGTINDSDSLLCVRDKGVSPKVFRELQVAHVRTYEVGPENIMDFVNYWSAEVPGGVILKDRFGGKGKGIIRVQKDDGYRIDLCGVDGEEDMKHEKVSETELCSVLSGIQRNHKLIGQPYVVSEHERSTDYLESESIRVLCADEYALGMSRRAEGPINNIAVSKNSLMQGRAVKTEVTPSEYIASDLLRLGLNLRVMGNDFIRTDPELYRDTPGVLWLPERYGGGPLSVLLEVNGNVQYGGIQELYQTNISEKIVEGLCGGRDSNPRTH